MVDNKPETPDRPGWHDIVAEIRDDAELAQELNRKEKPHRWRPHEVRVGRSPWIVRGGILLLALITVVEVALFIPIIDEKNKRAADSHRPAEQVFHARPPTPTIAPAPPTATDLPPEPTSEPVEMDKSF